VVLVGNICEKGKVMLQARLLVEKQYPAAWVFTFEPLKAGTIVPVVRATNIPGDGMYWINTPELKDDAYGILLYPGEYELIKNNT
jgi:hypothetical protein